MCLGLTTVSCQCSSSPHFQAGNSQPSGLSIDAASFKSTNSERVAESPLQVLLPLRDIDGQELKAWPTQGSPLIVVNFWASWCAPCVEETPSLLHLAESLGDQIFILLISEDDDRKDVRDFLKLYPGVKANNVFVVFDDKHKIANHFGVHKFPETFIYDKNFKLIKKAEGAVDWSSPEMRSQFIHR